MQQMPYSQTTFGPSWLFALLVGAIALGLAGCTAEPSGPHVVDLEPSGVVPQTTNFTWLFSDAMVPETTVDEVLMEAPIVFSPPIPGTFTWEARNTLRFLPDVVLAPSTAYEATLQPQVFAQWNQALSGEQTFAFQTERLRVTDAFLSFEFYPRTNQEAQLIASLEFNYPVDPQAVREHTNLYDANGQPIPFEVTTASAGTLIELEATRVTRSEQEAEIALHLTPDLTPVGGMLGLESEYVRPIQVPGQENLDVEQVQAVRESASNLFLRLTFNLPIREENAASYVRLEPSVETEAVVSNRTLLVRGDFETGRTYRVTVDEELLAVDGSTMARSVERSVTFQEEDIPPQIGFVGDGFYLPRNGSLNLGLSTINVDRVALEIDKIFANNLVQVLNAYNLTDNDGYYYYGAPLAALGTNLHREDLVVPLQRNQEVVTPLAMGDYLMDERRGIFRVTAREHDRRWRSTTRWVVATDIGLVAKQAGDALWVWANSLTDLDAIANAEVTLYSQNNQILATARTDAEGIAVFNDYTRFTEDFVPFVITASTDNDLSFLELQRRQIQTADFDVDGATYLQNGYEAYLYNERGVYRPGETAHMGAIVRGANTSVPTPFPVRLRVTGPDGKILSEQRTALNEQGGAAFAIDVPTYALTGRYTAALLLGDEHEIGRTTFSIEEFVPDRMKVTVATDVDTYRPGERMRIDVNAMMLFGPPAADRPVQANLALEPIPFAPGDYTTFTFGNEERTFTPVTHTFPDASLDSNGDLRLDYVVPEDLTPPAALRGVIEASVLEPSGRGVTAYHGVVIHPYESYIGLRQRDEGYATPNQPFTFDVVALRPNEVPIAERDLQVSLYHIYWNTIWRKTDSGQYRYVSEQVESLENTFSITFADGIGALAVTPPDYGRYKVVVEDPVSGASTVAWFYSSGWGYSRWALDNPDRIELELDKERYLPGEAAQVLVRAPFAGKLLLTVERDGIYDHQIVDLTENTATLSVPVEASYKPNVYLSAHLIRSADGLEREEVARAFGVVPLTVDAEANRLAVSIKAPADMRPQRPLDIEIDVDGGDGAAYVTVAAVDEGILQLTDFQTPDAHTYFFSKKRLNVVSSDLYSVILPDVSGSNSSPGGDLETARKRRLNPADARRVKPVAFWSGLVETDRQGRVRLQFEVPSFNGRLRVMALAYDGDQFGHAEQDVIVRDEIVVMPTFPRFIGSGDTFVVPVSVRNGTGEDATFTVSLQADGPVSFENEATQTVQVANDREAAVFFRLQAAVALGKTTFTLRTEGNGATTETTTEVSVRPGVPFTTVAGSGSIEAGQTAEITMSSAFYDGTDAYELVVSSFPTVQFSGSLQYLLQYPHGCVEQTTSRLFPLLTFDALAQAVEPNLFATNNADYFLEEGIAKLEQMQLPSGAFAYWPGGSYANTWGTLYAAHFLVEARKNGHVVADRVYDRMLDAVASIARDYRSDNASSYTQSAYAVYVLALAGRADKSTQLYLFNNARDDLQPSARYHLAGAFAFSGDRTTAQRLLPVSATPPAVANRRETGDTFYSPIRAHAIMLDMLAEVDPGHPQIPNLVQTLTQAAEDGRWYSTQDNAYAFLALGKILRQQASTAYTGTLSVDGETLSTFDPSHQRFASEGWDNETLTLAIEGTGTAYYYWRAEGLPNTPTVDQYDRDLSVRRRFLYEDGTPINDLTAIPQGEVIVAEITVRALAEDLQNVAVIDLLPTGLEIENPRLQSRRGIDWIAENAYTPTYMDIRDDRIIFYGDFYQGQSATIYYALRAVTAGSFTLPPIRAEAMYAPMKASVSSSGRIRIQAMDADATLDAGN